MINQIKAIQDRLENIVADITLLSQEAGKIDNRDKVSLELEKKLNAKSLDLSVKEKKFKDRADDLEKQKNEISKYVDKFSVREKAIIQREQEIKDELEKLESLKRELAKRELSIVDNETEREKLEIDRRDFEIIRSKVEKERQISRDRKEMLDERERQISAKEELLRKRLNS